MINVKVRAIRIRDFRSIVLQPSQAKYSPVVNNPDNAARLIAASHPLSGTFLTDGVVRAIGGYLPTDEAYMLLGKDLRDCMVPLCREIRRRLDDFLLTGRRPWATIEVDDETGRRFFRLLGMREVRSGYYEF